MTNRLFLFGSATTQKAKKKMTKKLTKTNKSPKQKAESSGLHFTKMTGTGNDFLIFDARDKTFPKFDRTLFSKAICRRSFSVGADGVVFIEKTKTPQVSFRWDFYNADGSVAEMCGNAARCVARYALENNIADRTTSFETLAGVVHTRVRSSGLVEVEMTKPELLARGVEVSVGEHIKLMVDYLNTGVPHVVRLNDDWDADYLNEMGSYLRHHELFAETNGANATFYEVTGPSKIHSATFERGVEGVTLACGTGAVAAAAVAILEGMTGPVEVEVPGGILHVDVDKALTHATLAGEARFICRGEIQPEALL
jgi:diaminopimelate epimerase